MFQFWIFMLVATVTNTKIFGLIIQQCYKAGCIFPIVVVSILPIAEFGTNDHREGAPHLNFQLFSFGDDRLIALVFLRMYPITIRVFWIKVFAKDPENIKRSSIFKPSANPNAPPMSDIIFQTRATIAHWPRAPSSEKFNRPFIPLKTFLKRAVLMYNLAFLRKLPKKIYSY